MIRSISTAISKDASFLARRGPTCVGLVLGLAALSSCVATKDYSDAKSLAAHYQEQVLDRDKTIADLQAQLEKQKRAFAASELSNIQNGGFGENDLDAKLSELQNIVNGMNRPMNDVERFEVEGGYVVVVQDKILFDSGSAELSAEGRKILTEEAGKIGAKAHGRIWVRGHTDSDPVSKPATLQKFPHGNMQLSAARAIEVAAELVDSKKVPARDVVVAGFGQYDPLKKNDSADNKRLNRRVEIFVANQGEVMATPAAGSKDK